MRTQFIKYTPPEMPQLLFTLRVEREPDGDYYIQGGNVQVTRNGKTHAREFEGGWTSKLLRSLEVDEAELRLHIENEMSKEKESLLSRNALR